MAPAPETSGVDCDMVGHAGFPVSASESKIDETPSKKRFVRPNYCCSASKETERCITQQPNGQRPLPKLQASIVLCLDVLVFQFQRLNRKIDETPSKKWFVRPNYFCSTSKETERCITQQPNGARSRNIRRLLCYVWMCWLSCFSV